jgi:hypothetical protein
MKKVSGLAANEAVAVEAKGIIDIQEGEQVLVGVKCVYLNGRFMPVTPAFKLTKNMFDYCDVGEVVVLKRINNPQNTINHDPAI